jgi:3-dehydroquinate synthase
MRTISVKLGARAYPISLGEGLLSRTGELLQQAVSGRKVGIVTNPIVAEFYLDVVKESLTRSGFDVSLILVPDGEEHKNLSSLSAIYDRLISERFDRSSSLIALGGGVIGDLTGFAAATFLRGIPHIQIPTTLLAQVDASVGGKTAVNHRDGKNLIGAFYQPRSVLIDLAVLQTLPRRELVAGLAEVIKYGIIEDPRLFARLEESVVDLLNLDRDILEEVIAASCSIKSRVVEKAEREEDYRSVLNFGHTIGHALESLTGYEMFLHGEAVAVGMVLAASISKQEGFCSDADLKRIHLLIRKTGLPTGIPAGMKLEDLVKKIEVDKKSLAGRIKFVLCAGIGRTRFHWLSAEEIIGKLTC